VASLRLDARGVGESVSDGVEAWEHRWTAEELAQDARAALEWLRGRGEIDGERVGMIAFSDGCSIAALAASQMEDAPAFVVLLSASSSTGAERLLAAQWAQLKMTGATREEMDSILPKIEASLEALAGDASLETCRRRVTEAMLAMGAPQEQAEHAAEAALEELGQRGVRWHLGHDPLPALRALRAPSLAIVGGADDRHGAGSVPALRDALGPNRVVVMEGLGHFLESEQETVFTDGVVEQAAGFVQGLWKR